MGLRAIAAALLFASCVPCPKINQRVTVSSADEALLALFDACLASQPASANALGCRPPSVSQQPCPCLPLCQRVLQIIDQFQGPEDLETCIVSPLADAGIGGGIVDVTYRPSTCQ